MKFKVNREKLNKAFQKVNSLVGGNNSMPFLNNVLLKAENGLLELTTSNVDMWAHTAIEAEIEVPGVTTAPARKLASLIGAMNGENVEFDVDDNDHIKMVCGTGRFRLLGLSSVDYPGMPALNSLQEVQIKESEFKELIKSISYAVSKESSRKALTGVFFSIEGGMLTTVATDGKRLAMQEKAPESVVGEDGCTIVPLKAVNEVQKALEGEGTLKITIADKHCRFETANFCLLSKLIDGVYPNYRAVVPTSFARVITLPVEPLLAKVETVALMLPDATHSIVLAFSDNKVAIEAVSTQLGEGQDVMDVAFEGEAFEVSFNPQFLIDPLRTTSAETINFKLNDPLNPVTLEAEEGFINVIMPIRKKAPAAQ